MAYYLVRAKPKPERLPELQEQLQANAFIGLRPFGNRGHPRCGNPQIVSCWYQQIRDRPAGRNRSHFGSPNLGNWKGEVMVQALEVQ